MTFCFLEKTLSSDDDDAIFDRWIFTKQNKTIDHVNMENVKKSFEFEFEFESKIPFFKMERREGG